MTKSIPKIFVNEKKFHANTVSCHFKNDGRLNCNVGFKGEIIKRFPDVGTLTVKKPDSTAAVQINSIAYMTNTKFLCRTGSGEKELHCINLKK